MTIQVAMRGAVGVAIRLQFAKDVSLATSIKIWLKPRDGSAKEFDGAKISGAPMDAQYVTAAASDLNVATKWMAEGLAIWDDGTSLPSIPGEFDVYENLWD